MIGNEIEFEVRSIQSFIVFTHVMKVFYVRHIFLFH